MDLFQNRIGDLRLFNSDHCLARDQSFRDLEGQIASSGRTLGLCYEA
jgi:hypothetical protein